MPATPHLRTGDRVALPYGLTRTVETVAEIGSDLGGDCLWQVTFTESTRVRGNLAPIVPEDYEWTLSSGKPSQRERLLALAAEKGWDATPLWVDGHGETFSRGSWRVTVMFNPQGGCPGGQLRRALDAFGAEVLPGTSSRDTSSRV